MHLILKYFSHLTDKQRTHYERLLDIYKEWNSKINVISRKDIDNLYLHHILHSLAIAKVIQFKPHTKILDIGTGGGFPGIPLAIMFPECQFHLVDSIGKKITVVKEITKSLDLKNVTSEVIRAEAINTQFDFIVSRAVTSLPVFMGWCKNKIRKENINDLKNGILYLKGEDGLNINLKNKIVKIYEINKIYDESFFHGKIVTHIF